uniref:Lymphotoxin alpha (TNF superfamily, member 1) n=1 Tax=Cyprinus carpio carpio TaxID=630221 RepID=A0A9J8AT32_CYPCA
MTSSSHPWFRLLIGWCCLMSSALLIMTVYLANLHKTSSKTGEEQSKDINRKTEQQIDFWHGPSFSDYIRLIRDKEKTWICSKPCESSFVSLENSTVVVTVSGLYYFHAQVYFKQITQTNEMPTVTLIKNKGPGTELRKLSEVKRNGPGSLTMICLVKLNKGDSISLNINHINGLSGEDYDTFLEIILFNK